MLGVKAETFSIWSGFPVPSMCPASPLHRFRTFRGAIALIVGFEGLHQLVESPDEVIVAQPVIDRGALFARAHQVQFQQLTQVLRGCGGSQPQLAGNLPCIEFVPIWGILSIGRDKQLQNRAPTFVTGSI